MTPGKLLSVVLLSTVVILAAGPSAASPDALPTHAAPGDEILELAPADACLIAYTANFEFVAKHHLLTSLATPTSGVPALVQTFVEAIDGAAMISATGAPVNPLSWRVSIAARTSLTQDELFQHLATKVIPAWNQSPLTSEAGELQFLPIGKVGRLMLVGPVPLFMTLAMRDGLVFGSTRPGQAEEWLRGADVGDSFIYGEEFERLNDGRSAGVGGLVYLDLRSLMPMAETGLNQVLPDLAEALQINNVESLALISDRRMVVGRSPRTMKPTDDGAGLRIAVGVMGIERGMTHLIASTPARPTLARVFPPDTKLLLHGSMEQATSVVDDLNAFAAVIDQDIVDEYKQERADFKQEIGFDPHTEFLGNFVAEWAFGVTDPSLGDALAAVRLASPGTFKTSMRRLRVAYQLEIDLTKYRNVAITRAARPAGPFFYAVVEDVLLVSPAKSTIKQAINAVLDDKGLAHTPAFAAVNRRLGSHTSKLVFWDMASFFADAVESGEAAEFPSVVELVRSGDALGFAAVPHERMIALELVSSGGHALGLVDVLAMTVVPSLQRARHLSQRTVSMANVKGIIIACHIHASDHKGQWPGSLEKLVADGSLHATQVFVYPYDPALESTEPYYLYRRLPDTSKPKGNWEIVVSEPAVHDGGAVFGFLDGHVEWIASPRADELLTIMHDARKR